MKYCFVDESGNPSPKNRSPFVVALVILDSIEEVSILEKKIIDLKIKNRIPMEYEFHFSRNALPRKNLFLDFIKKNVHDYYAFIAEKTNSIKIYEEISMQIVSRMSVEEKYNIRLDTNPKLFKALRTNLRSRKISAKLKQVESKGSSLIQVADYVAGIAAKITKNKETPLNGEFLRWPA